MLHGLDKHSSSCPSVKKIHPTHSVFLPQTVPLLSGLSFALGRPRIASPFHRGKIEVQGGAAWPVLFCLNPNPYHHTLIFAAQGLSQDMAGRRRVTRDTAWTTWSTFFWSGCLISFRALRLLSLRQEVPQDLFPPVYPRLPTSVKLETVFGVILK